MIKKSLEKGFSGGTHINATFIVFLFMKKYPLSSLNNLKIS